MKFYGDTNALTVIKDSTEGVVEVALITSYNKGYEDGVAAMNGLIKQAEAAIEQKIPLEALGTNNPIMLLLAKYRTSLEEKDEQDGETP